MPDREYNSSDEDSVTTDSNEGKEEEEDSSDYESSDDETTLPQVTTLESVLAMIPFTPDWRDPRRKVKSCFNLRSVGVGEVLSLIRGRVTRCLPRRWEARAANEALHNRRKMVAETNRAKHLGEALRGGHARRRAARAAP